MKIEGLTQRQMEIADDLWSCQSHEEVLEYIETLSEKDRYDARSLVICMLQNAIEEDSDGNNKQAVMVIESIMRKL